MLTSAGFLCDDQPDGVSYSCGGTDTTKGNQYQFDVVIANNAISAFTLSARASGSAASPDIAAAAVYFDAVLNQIVPDDEGIPIFVGVALANPGSIGLEGTYLLASLAPDASSLAITGTLAARLSGHIVIPSANLDSALKRLGYTCAPSTAVTPKPQTDCANSGDIVSYQVGEDGLIYRVSFSATTKSSIEKVLALMFMPSDATAFGTWLETAGNSATKAFGPYAVSLSSKNGALILTISLP
jgi:hypothetical protein